LQVDATKLWGDADMPPEGSWVVTVQTEILTVPSLINTIPIVPLECIATPSAGGAQSRFLFDPNTALTVNAPSFTVSVRWQSVAQNTTAGVDPFVVPPLVRVQGLAHLTTAQFGARKSNIFPANTLPAGRAFFFDIPPFAKDFGIRTPDSSVIWLAGSSIGFVSGFAGTGVVLSSWDGASFLAQMKDRGYVPVPSRAATGFVRIGGTKGALDNPWITDFGLAA